MSDGSELSPWSRPLGGAAMLAILAAYGVTLPDNKFALTGSSDATKIGVFELDANTTGTTRTYSLPNATTMLAGLAVAQTFTALQTISFAAGNVPAFNVESTTAANYGWINAIGTLGGQIGFAAGATARGGMYGDSSGVTLYVDTATIIATLATGGFTIAGSKTFSTGTGAVSINGSATVATGKTLTLTDIADTRFLYSVSGVVTGSAVLTQASGGIIVNLSTGQTLLTVSDNAVGSYGTVRIKGGSGHYNFQIGANDIANNSLTIAASTAVNGTTFSTAIVTLDGATGAVALLGKARINNTQGFGTAGLAVTGTAGTVAGASPALMILGSGNANDIADIGFHYTTGASNVPAAMGFLVTNAAGQTAGALIFSTRSVTTDTAPTERMRIAADGVVTVAGALVSTGTVFANAAGGNLRIKVDGTGTNDWGLFTSGATLVLSNWDAPLATTQFAITNTKDSSSTSTGCLIAAGGVGIAGKLYTGGDVHLGGHVFIASGKELLLGNNYVNTPTIATGYVLITDLAGTVYEIPAKAH